jgi:hypothetical protein
MNKVLVSLVVIFTISTKIFADINISGEAKEWLSEIEKKTKADFTKQPSTCLPIELFSAEGQEGGPKYIFFNPPDGFIFEERPEDPRYIFFHPSGGFTRSHPIEGFDIFFEPMYPKNLIIKVEE